MTGGTVIMASNIDIRRTGRAAARIAGCVTLLFLVACGAAENLKRECRRLTHAQV